MHFTHPASLLSLALSFTLGALAQEGCGDNLGQVPCTTSTPTASTSAPATVVSLQDPSGTCDPSLSGYEECARIENENADPCQSADDCTAGCADQLQNNTQALTVGFASTCTKLNGEDYGSCSCSVAAAEFAAEILIEIGEITCVVWNEAAKDAAAILAFVVPYVGAAAEGVDATLLFKAAGKVFKKGAKDCDLACPGHQYTAVDPMDVDTMAGIEQCGDDEPTGS